MDISTFSDIQQTYPDAEQLPFSGSTCDCYRVRLYGKLHFLKRLKSDLRTDPRYVAAIHKEFEIGYGLDHPNLVRYLSCGDDYLLTEYIDGETLKDFLESHPDYFKTRKHTDRFLSQLLSVLGYLHSHQIVHLDLKPDNILITRIGYDVKLTDLGYCYTDTYTDTKGRTDKYAAPEQLQGVLVDAHTDIYAIGKILEQFPTSSIYNKVIARSTAKDPSFRYQTVEEMIEVLKRKHAKLVYFVVLILALLICTLSYYLLQDYSNRITTEQTQQPDSEQPSDSTKAGFDNSLPVNPKRKPSAKTSKDAIITTEDVQVSKRELSGKDRHDIRHHALGVIRPVYERMVVPVVTQILNSEYDGRMGYIRDSLAKVYVNANEEIRAILRKDAMENHYPHNLSIDVSEEENGAIGDVMRYYDQIIMHHQYPAVKAPSNPFEE